MIDFVIPEVSLYHIEVLDGQHQGLVDEISCLNEYLGSSDMDQVSAAFDGIMVHLKTHFSDEEELMLKSKYPGFGSHRVHHQNLIFRATEMFHLVLERGALTETDVHNIFDEIIRHMLTSDGSFNSFLNAKNTSYRQKLRLQQISEERLINYGYRDLQSTEKPNVNVPCIAEGPLT